MNRRSLVLWSLSAVLLAWMAAMTWHGKRLEACIAEGGRWDMKRWTCDRDLGRIIIERGMKRSWLSE